MAFRQLSAERYISNRTLVVFLFFSCVLHLYFFHSYFYQGIDEKRKVSVKEKGTNKTKKMDYQVFSEIEIECINVRI